MSRTLLAILCCQESLLKRVTDQPRHDRRYTVSYAKIGRELGWHPEISFTTGLRSTIHWYGLNLPTGQVA